MSGQPIRADRVRLLATRVGAEFRAVEQRAALLSESVEAFENSSGFPRTAGFVTRTVDGLVLEDASLPALPTQTLGQATWTVTDGTLELVREGDGVVDSSELDDQVEYWSVRQCVSIDDAERPLEQCATIRIDPIVIQTITMASDSTGRELAIARPYPMRVSPERVVNNDAEEAAWVALQYPGARRLPDGTYQRLVSQRDVRTATVGARRCDLDPIVRCCYRPFVNGPASQQAAREGVVLVYADSSGATLLLVRQRFGSIHRMTIDVSPPITGPSVAAGAVMSGGIVSLDVQRTFTVRSISSDHGPVAALVPAGCGTRVARATLELTNLDAPGQPVAVSAPGADIYTADVTGDGPYAASGITASGVVKIAADGRGLVGASFSIGGGEPSGETATLTAEISDHDIVLSTSDDCGQTYDYKIARKDGVVIPWTLAQGVECPLDRPVRIHVEGDSWTDPTLWTWQTWHEALGERSEYTIVNGGGIGSSVLQSSPGAPSTSIFDRLTAVSLDGIDVLAIIAGVNDMKSDSLNDAAIERMQSAVTAIIAQCAASDTRLVISTCQPFGGFAGFPGLGPWDATKEGFRQQYNDWLVNQTSDQVVVVRLDPVIDVDGDAAIDAAYDDGSGIHVNGNGNRVIATAFRDALTALYGELTQVNQALPPEVQTGDFVASPRGSHPIDRSAAADPSKMVVRLPNETGSVLVYDQTRSLTSTRTVRIQGLIEGAPGEVVELARAGARASFEWLDALYGYAVTRGETAAAAPPAPTGPAPFVDTDWRPEDGTTDRMVYTIATAIDSTVERVEMIFGDRRRGITDRAAAPEALSLAELTAGGQGWAVDGASITKEVPMTDGATGYIFRMTLTDEVLVVEGVVGGLEVASALGPHSVHYVQPDA